MLEDSSKIIELVCRLQEAGSLKAALFAFLNSSLNKIFYLVSEKSKKLCSIMFCPTFSWLKHFNSSSKDSLIRVLDSKVGNAFSAPSFA